MELVREARRQEIDGFSKRRVYEIRPRYEAEAAGDNIIWVRWVDCAKNGGVRSRLVCQELNTDSKRSDDMFAPTPPLLASRRLVSLMASQGNKGPGGMRIMALYFCQRVLVWRHSTRSVY